jgi:IS1 family transposase/transposase-like protein
MRRPRAWGQPCPNAKCPLFKLMDRGNVSAISTYMTESGKRRIFRCQRCETTFSETRDTVFFDLRTSEEKVLMALKMLLVRVDLSGIAFVLGVHEETVLAWLVRAAAKAHEINEHLLRDLPVTQVQLDEMWNFIARKHARETDEAGESLPEGEDGRQWVWVSFAPEFRLMIAAVVGPRTLDTAKEVVAVTKARVAGIPAFFSDGFTCYLAALIAAFHVVTTCARTGKRGRPRRPVCEPHPDLVYAQLVKQKKQGKRRTLSTRVVLGAERLTQLRLTISTALVERVNLTLRQALAPLARKTSSFCKDRERMRQRVVLFQAFYNVARPHMSLRRQLPVRERNRHGAIRPRWRERTPAMAAGLTDHVWTFRELLTAKFEPLDSQSISR